MLLVQGSTLQKEHKPKPVTSPTAWYLDFPAPDVKMEEQIQLKGTVEDGGFLERRIGLNL